MGITMTTSWYAGRGYSCSARTKPSNPYRADPDPNACASCGAPIEQPPTGRPRRFCASDQCRRDGLQRDALASAWDEGWDAAALVRNPSRNDVDLERAAAFDSGYQQGRIADRRFVAALVAAVRRHLRKCPDNRGRSTIEGAILRINDRYDIEAEATGVSTGEGGMVVRSLRLKGENSG